MIHGIESYFFEYVDSATLGHSKIQHHHVRFPIPNQFDGCTTIPSLTDNLEFWKFRYHRSESFVDEL